MSLLLLSGNAFAATTWYVRTDGSTSTNCTGTTNAAYPGTGTGQACAFSHPSYVTGATGTSGVWAGGDTMIIKDTQADGSTQAQFMIGYGMSNTSGCSAFAPVDCVLNTIPSGPDAAHPTRILGSSYASCTSKPQLWGTQSVKQIIKLQSVANIDIECVEITDHSACGFRVGGNQCSESYPLSGVNSLYGREGLAGAGVANLTLRYVDVHGLSDRNIELGDLSGTATISYVNIDGAFQAGWDGDTRSVYGGTGAINTGTMNIDHVKTRFNGCQEAYPRSSTFNSADYSGCTDQNAAGYGDGWASYDAGGTYNITNSEWSHNTQDGFDLLYCPNNCVFNIDKSLFEGNDGNQLKVSAKTLNLTNSILIANCTYLQDTGKVWNTGSWSSCRANGTPLSVTVVAGSNYSFYNNTAYTANNGSGSPFIEVVNRYGTCNGTETYTYKNNVLVNPNATWTAYYNGLSGSCSTAWQAATTANSDIYNFSSAPSGTGVINSNPLWVSSIVATLDSNVSKVYLQAGSPAKGTAASGLSYWNTSSDYNSYRQNSPVDMGALQYGSTAGTSCTANGSFCSINGDCCSTYCVSNACSATPVCINNGNACSVNGDCCSGFCNGSLVCAVAGGTTGSGISGGFVGKCTTSGKLILN